MEKPRWGTSAYLQAKRRELMPKDYSQEIKQQMRHYREIHSDTLTEPEIGALAAHQVLSDRLTQIGREYDLSETRLEPAAKISWAQKQIERVDHNRHYQSALTKLVGDRK